MTSNWYIGLLSGTSIDSIDAALVDCNPAAEKPLQCTYTHSHPIPTPLKMAISALCQPGPDEINRLGQCDAALGELFAEAVTALLDKTPITADAVCAIGSHGQTVRHQPDMTPSFTLQIGDPNIIAERTGITVIADFRRRDIACGGQGAPLAPALHHALLHSAEENRVILNIGGMANMTYLPKDNSRAFFGFDTGPGNVLLDAWSLRCLDQPFDAAGQWAAQGCVHTPLLEHLLAHPYFAKTPPKSTGRELFHLDWLLQARDSVAPDAGIEDVQATLLALSATSIAKAITQFAPDCDRVAVCGGGVHNLTLMHALTQQLPHCRVDSTDALGVAPDWLEAIAFAWLAERRLANQAIDLSTVTHARVPAVLGAVYAKAPVY